ncbi:MAG: type II toxin-antitoxin system HicB family antitoxin [Firmicutes bacterium]|jgi:predicted RNase H-like HicB family nuclease|nr:type II toxin-antitoxin system HicB family antitoxin [Bacillota bacterium]
MEYLVVIEKAENGYSAYVPDVPGCVAAGNTPAKARARLAEALEMHLAGLAEDGLPKPSPAARADYSSVSR